MQPYSHFFIAAASAPFISSNPWAQAAWIVGNVIPDTTVCLQWAIDRFWYKIPPLVYEPPKWVTAKNFCHSLVVALLVTGFGVGHMPIMLFGIGMVIHITIDILTHKSENSNCVYAWPLAMKSYCLWEYQIADGVIRPRKPELIICLICIMIIAFNTLPTILSWW